MSILELIGLFVVAMIIGISVALFIKTVLKIFLFFTGFYVLVTGLLWYIGLIRFTITLDDIYSKVSTFISSLPKSNTINIMMEVSPQIAIILIGFVVGLWIGFRKVSSL